jgi:hypothetical protein
MRPLNGILPFGGVLWSHSPLMRFSADFISYRQNVSQNKFLLDKEGIMHVRTTKFLYVTLAFLVFLCAGSLAAQERGASHGIVSEAASGPPSAYLEHFGVGLAPPVYLVNFLLLYFSNPENAAYMPAYRAELPQEVNECLQDPQTSYGCPYDTIEKYFDEQAFDSGGSRNKNSFWPSDCQTDPRWQRLAPRKYRHSDQINEPLGKRKSEQLARLLGIDDDMILTDEEYQCLITPASDEQDPIRDIINSCINYLTNSNGNADPPLSSYGLYMNDEGDVRSLCAPDAPCLEFNKLFLGPLEVIADRCGFLEKLIRLTIETPLPQFIKDGNRCQNAWEPSCIFDASPGNAGQ